MRCLDCTVIFGDMFPQSKLYPFYCERCGEKRRAVLKSLPDPSICPVEQRNYQKQESGTLNKKTSKSAKKPERVITLVCDEIKLKLPISKVRKLFINLKECRECKKITDRTVCRDCSGKSEYICYPQ